MFHRSAISDGWKKNCEPCLASAWASALVKKEEMEKYWHSQQHHKKKIAFEPTRDGDEATVVSLASRPNISELVPVKFRQSFSRRLRSSMYTSIIKRYYGVFPVYESPSGSSTDGVGGSDSSPNSEGRRLSNESSPQSNPSRDEAQNMPQDEAFGVGYDSEEVVDDISFGESLGVPSSNDDLSSAGESSSPSSKASSAGDGSGRSRKSSSSSSSSSSSGASLFGGSVGSFRSALVSSQNSSLLSVSSVGTSVSADAEATTSGLYGGGSSLGFYAGDGDAKEMEEGDASSLPGRAAGIPIAAAHH
jgi:hypothetical protein